jgi:allophanate hydrolase
METRTPMTRIASEWDPWLGDLSLSSLSRHYTSGDLVPADVLHAIFRRIEARGADSTWISLASEESTKERAILLDRQGSRIDLPLYGVPFAVKDNIDVAGLPTTAACPAFSYLPKTSAPAVTKLIAAGAICIGKTNLDQFATGLSGVRSPYGPCASVFNRDYASGESSSGSAVAVGAGLVTFALGTDTGGSGRIPAGYNNIVGLKPTLGRVSLCGVVPNCRTLDTVSVFSLTCADGVDVLRVIEGFDPDDSFSRVTSAGRKPDRFISEQGLGGLTIGVPQAKDREFFGNREAERLFDSAIARITALGGATVEIEFADFLEAGRMMFDGPWVAERVVALADFLAAHRDAVLPVTRRILQSASRWSAADAFQHLYRLRSLKRRTEATIWSRIDALLVPTAATAFTIAELNNDPIVTNNRIGHYSYFVNLLDLCALAIPNGFLESNGVAMGVTLIAPAWNDEFLASIGDACHRALDTAPGLAGLDRRAADRGH